jgi:hypothetical protein
MRGKEEIEAELALIDAAINGILKGGQSYMINSGGGSRNTTNANLETLYKRRDRLEYALACVSGGTHLKMGAGW